jgi:hypothetical protein
MTPMVRPLDQWVEDVFLMNPRSSVNLPMASSEKLESNTKTKAPSLWLSMRPCSRRHCYPKF